MIVNLNGVAMLESTLKYFLYFLDIAYIIGGSLCCCCCCCCCLPAKGLPEVDPCEGQHLCWVGRKDLEGWKRTSEYVLPSCIEPGAPP